MTAKPVDRMLLDALEYLDTVCNDRGILAEAMQDELTGQVALAIHLRPVLGNGTPLIVRAVYNDRTHEWVRALALRIRRAQIWRPREWARQAANDVLGTTDAPADQLASVLILDDRNGR